MYFRIFRKKSDPGFRLKRKIMYPGDPNAEPYLVYNCRCTLIPQVKGFEYDVRSDDRTDYSGIEGMTYDEWKASRVEKPNRITLPEEKAAAIKGSYINDYRKLRTETLAKSEKSGIIKNKLKVNIQQFAKPSDQFPTVWLDSKEYAHVMSEIATNLTEEQANNKVFKKFVGNYVYTVENNGFGNYRIIGKVKIQ